MPALRLDGGASHGAAQCPRCRTVWAVELRHARSACPACRRVAELAFLRLLWRGNGAREAQAAVAAHASAPHGGTPVAPPPVPRHDSPLDAAAAQARGIVNRSARAEEVARWCTRLLGTVAHGDLVAAMVGAGLGPDRAEREIVRMLACDVILEPRAGHYACMDG